MKSVIRLGMCVAALWGGAALAQSDWSTSEQDPGNWDTSDRDRSERVRWQENRGADDGLYILLGGGAEGYVGDVGTNLNVGPAAGATVGFKPTDFVGLEVSYSGGMHDIDVGPGGVSEGADLIRHGANAAATFGFTDTKLQPYVLGGIGMETYNVRGVSEGFADDTSAFVPAGLGLRYQLGDLISADARVTYNMSLGNFATAADNSPLGDGRYQGLLMLGGTY
jgi:hypothetical protein